MLERLKHLIIRESSSDEKAKKRTLEHPAFKEQWEINFAVIIIAGESGTGKTTLAEFFGQIYKIPDERNIKVGQIIRGLQEKPKEENFIERPIALDQQVDNLQRDIIAEKAAVTNPYIIEGKLAGVIAKEEKDKNPQLMKISILLTAPDDIAYDRIRRRRPDLSRKEVARQTRERAEKDLAQWTQAHPQLSGTNPYNTKFYDLVINTDGKSVEQVFDEAHKYFLEKEHVKRKTF